MLDSLIEEGRGFASLDIADQRCDFDLSTFHTHVVQYVFALFGLDS